MKQQYFQKIQHYLQSSKGNRKNRKGALTLLSIFLFFVFSTLSMGMIYLTQIYLRISAYRKNSILLDYASENGIKQGFDRLNELLLPASSPLILDDKEVSELRDDVYLGGKKIVKKILGDPLPIVDEDDWERMTWECMIDFQFFDIQEKEDYFRVRYEGEIAAKGKLAGFKHEKESSLYSDLRILAGHIPLSVVPVLVDKNLSNEQKTGFLEENTVEMLAPGPGKSAPPVSFSDGELLPQDATKQLANALNIKMFLPQDLTNWKLRSILGLEVNNEPVPDSVYLIMDDMGIGGVFVQGDLDEMLLAIQSNLQFITFKKGQDLWILRFSPEDGQAEFFTPSEVQYYEYVPRGIIIVNGKIHSLGGGYMDKTGRIELSEQEIPCVLRGVNLTILSSDEITLTSHLIYEGVRWQEGVPYIKDSQSQLIIHAAGKDFLDGSETLGRIIIDEASPDEIKIHASMSAAGEGILVKGENKEVQVLGSLQTKDFDLNGNIINLKFDDRFFEEGEDVFQNAARTEKPVLFLSSFIIKEWRENL
jgi:hypothetical protein